MKIHEILDRKVEQEVTLDDSENYRTKATIGQRIIHFSAELDDPEEDEWAVVFWQTDLNGKGMKFEVTKGGKELEVFSMVKGAMMEFIKKRNPKIIFFSAAKGKGEEGRSDLYDRLIRRFKLPNYECEKRTEEMDDHFYLVRK